MADGNRSFDFGRELVVDLFAGAGGASAGIEDEYRAPDIAVNHNPIAIAVHKANHPNTRHYMADVFEVDPIEATGGRPVGILWGSPDCTHFSKAKGGKPRSRKIRGLAWVLVRWAYATRPRMILMENVEEFREWGPLGSDDRPVKVLRGRTFNAFRAVMTTGLPEDHPDMPEILAAIGDHVPKAALVRGLGYNVDFRELIAANYTTPTTRKRLYGVMRCDGRPIVWPEAEAFKVAANPAKRWHWAAECIDFSDLGKSIFERKKPLANASQRRVARGAWRHVLTAAKPFIVPLRGTSSAHHSTHSVDAPLSTITGQGTHHALAAPILTEFANASTQRTWTVEEPLRTQVAQVKGGHFALAAAHLVTNTSGHSGASLAAPVPTVATGGHHALAASVMIQAAHGEGKPGGVQRWGIGSTDAHEPLRTVTATASGGHAVANCHFEPTTVASHLITTGYGERPGQDARAQSIEAPLGTVVATGKHAVVSAHLTHLTHQGERSGTPMDEPMRTVTGAHRGEQAMVAAHLTAFGENAKGSGLNEPMQTVLAGAVRYGLVASHVVKFRGDSIGHPMDQPMPTITAGGNMARPAGAAHALGMASMFLEQANGGFYDGDGRSLHEPVSTIVGSGSQQRLVSAYLVKYYRDGGQLQGLDEPMHTLPTKGRMGLVQVVQVPANLLPPEMMAKAKRCAEFMRRWLPEHFPEPAELILVGDHVLVDITLRMLQPKELKLAQGFRPDYILDRGLFYNPETGRDEWRPITKTDQVKLIGNSVCRQVAAALVRANAADLIDLYHRIAA